MVGNCAEPTIKLRAKLLRALSVFCLVMLFCTSLQAFCPTNFFDYLGLDYNATSASHALLFTERAHGTPNSLNLNLSEHPGVPFYFAAGMARVLSGTDFGSSPTERCVNFFINIDKYWAVQAVLAAVIAAFGAAALSLYCNRAGVALCLALFGIPLTFLPFAYCEAYVYSCFNETFALPAAALFFLIADAIFNKSCTGNRPWAFFFLLGIMGGIAYSIKLPYIAISVTGFAVAPLAYGIQREAYPRLLKATILYIFGIATVMAVLAAIFGPEMVRTFVMRHYGVLMHTGFAGDGEAGIVSASAVWHNFKELSHFLWKFRIPCFLFLLLLGGLAASGQLRLLRKRNVGLIALLMTLYGLAVLKHWGDHYALVLFIFFIFLFYETARPYLCGQVIWPRKNISGERLRRIVTAVLCVALFGSVVRPIYKFSDRVDRLVSNRETKAEFLSSLDALPLKPDEGIYFQWGAHALPIFGITHPLSLTYLHEPQITYDTLRYFFPNHKMQSNLTYSVDKSFISLRYLVSWDPLRKEGVPIIPFDTPHPRLVFEPKDNIILQWRDNAYPSQSLWCTEKAVPIPPQH